LSAHDQTTLFGDDELETERSTTLELPADLTWIRRLGAGGMGEVHLVYDAVLQRRIALKTLRTTRMRPEHVTRFEREACTTAQLQHPGIITIHAMGTLPDQRPWFTMPAIRGTELTDWLLRHRTAGEPSLRDLVRILRRATEPLAYAHRVGVVHRDVKPDNVMVGEHGEVLVLDWGLARTGDDPPLAPADGSHPRIDSPSLTRTGALMGTPIYMAPEQITFAEITARTDVYALGAILYEVLNGRPPRTGSVPDVLAATAGGTPIRPSAGPPALARLVHACLSTRASERPAHAGIVGDHLEAWLEGRERSAEADELVQQAQDLDRAARRTLEHARTLQARADTELEAVGRYADREAKRVGWALEDQARAARRDAELERFEVENTLWTALSRDPGHQGARLALARHLLDRHQEAEEKRDADATLRTEVALRSHLAHLGDDRAAPFVEYLDGAGRITFDTAPSGATVIAQRYVERGRALEPDAPIPLGTTPLDVPLARGSWRLTLAHPDCDPVVYPVAIERRGTWSTTPPGAAGPEPVRLPPRGTLGPEDCFVAAGWFTAGGDPEARGARPARRLWCDAFITRRYHVTNREYLQFLDDLTATGHLADAERFAPRDYQEVAGAQASFWGRDDHGRWQILPDLDGDVWDPDWPVMMIDYASVAAYVTWACARDGLPWRVPSVHEYEKAARGVDARVYPWGDHFDPTFAAVEYHDGIALVVGPERPIDTSPYGVGSLAGNVSEYCLEARDTPPLRGERVVVGPFPIDAPSISSRGGSWSGPRNGVRAASIGFTSATRGLFTQGFRLTRSWP
jgi:serine/threonine-protein kinase